jgi:dUTP pyrophosphatase
MVNINVEVLDPKLVPVYANIGDAGADLVANQAAVVPAKGRILVKTGLKLALPMGYVGLVHPRSGLALKHGITVLNTPGTIDSGYRGEVGVILYNSTDSDFEVQIGDRIAQLVIQKYETGVFNIVESLDETSRGDGGFGSTGVGEL